jgi:hypothetical protein
MCSTLMRPRIRDQAEARRLRKEGKSLRQIAGEVNASVGSVSVWVRDVPRKEARDGVQEQVSGEGGVLEMPDSTETRRCGRCNNELPLSAFNRHPHGHQWWCRECFREYFRERGAKHRRQSGEARRRRRLAARQFVKEHLATHPCVDCGESDVAVLEFDHLREKLRELSQLVGSGASLAVIKTEIAKCEVVCCNCHRRRTAVRGKWRRASREWWRLPAPGDHLQSRNIAFAYSYLERHPCVDCGCSDLCVLEFDHVGPKTGNVLTLARNGVSLERLAREITQCEVRCANCHRRRTAGRRLAAA